MKSKIGYLYVNGLGSGKTRVHERLAIWWWRISGVKLTHIKIDWFNGSFPQKLETVKQAIEKALESHSSVAIIGSSAAGSLTVNAFYELSDKNICAIIAHGRLAEGDFALDSSLALAKWSREDNPKASQIFIDSVLAVEKTITKLSLDQKKRLFTLNQLADPVVPVNTMGIAGVRNHRSLTVGHLGGFLAHLIACRNKIQSFAEEVLKERATR